MIKFTYDDYGAFLLLNEKKKDRAFELNFKGALEGLTEQEYSELQSLFNEGAKIFEEKNRINKNSV